MHTKYFRQDFKLLFCFAKRFKFMICVFKNINLRNYKNTKPGISWHCMQRCASEKPGDLLLRHHTLHWQISFPWCPCPKGSLPYLLRCQLLGHSLQPVPQLNQLLDVVWSLMHFGADGFICLTDLQQDTAKTIKKSTCLLWIHKLGNLPWSTHFPFWRWSKQWVHSLVLFFFFSHPSHLSSNGMRLTKKEEEELQVCSGNDDNNRFRQPAGRGNCLYSSYSQRKQKDFPVVY